MPPCAQTDEEPSPNGAGRDQRHRPRRQLVGAEKPREPGTDDDDVVMADANWSG